MSHNRSHFECSSTNNEVSQQLIIKNAFDRLYERSPLPELLQSHLGHSPKKRFHGASNATPSDRINQIYASLRKTRKTDTSLPHSDHSASFSHNSSFACSSPHLNRSSDSVFRTPVQRLVDRDASFNRVTSDVQFSNWNRNSNYISKFSNVLDNEENLRPNKGLYGDTRDKFNREFTRGAHSHVSLREGNCRKKFDCDDENGENIEGESDLNYRQYHQNRYSSVQGVCLNSDQLQWRYGSEDEDNTRMSGCQWDKSRSDLGIQNEERHLSYQEKDLLSSPVIPMHGFERQPSHTRGPVMPDFRDQRHQHYKDSRSKEESNRSENSYNEDREAMAEADKGSDKERHSSGGYERAESDGSVSDIDLIPSTDDATPLRSTNHNSVTENPGHIGDQDLQSTSCQDTETDTEVTLAHPGATTMAEEDTEEQDKQHETENDNESLGKKDVGSNDGDEEESDTREESDEETADDTIEDGQGFCYHYTHDM
ncbi:protein starmaker-like [Ylistrum balloti]|uniref:protein starmaker-like n=1 Tax=Ylistrum balloti TaxID=509963 RepID=UPI002905BB93|nr:protein starmaker-like [Ylistrum balloti]